MDVILMVDFKNIIIIMRIATRLMLGSSLKAHVNARRRPFAESGSFAAHFFVNNVVSMTILFLLINAIFSNISLAFSISPTDNSHNGDS